MPSVSAKQAKLMNIAAHTPGGYGGVPQSVGREFHTADKAQHRSTPMAKESGFEISPRKSMAEGKGMPGAGDFGVESQHERTVEHVDGDNSGGHLHDHQRAAPHPVRHTDGHMHAQANADHGPHKMHKAGSHHAPMRRK